MFRGRRVAVVIPAFNEADKIAPTVASVPGFVDHVVIVDDGSADATAAAARGAALTSGRRDQRVVDVIEHASNRGVGAALATGYARALEQGADVVAVMAGDGQMDPADLMRLLAPVVDGAADYAKGNRFAWPRGWRVMPAARLAGSLALSWLTRAVTGYWHLSDSQCGYTVASRRALQAVDLPALFPRYGYPNDLLARLAAAGARVVDVPVRPVYGPAWRSGLRPTRVALPILRLLARALWRRLRARRRPAALLAPAPEPPWSSAS